MREAAPQLRAPRSDPCFILTRPHHTPARVAAPPTPPPPTTAMSVNEEEGVKEKQVQARWVPEGAWGWGLGASPPTKRRNISTF